jgi:hypothetical protein
MKRVNYLGRRFGDDARSAPPRRREARSGVKPVEECARQIARAMDRRDRELVMTLPGKLGEWLRLIAPSLLDRLVATAIERFDREERLP